MSIERLGLYGPIGNPTGIRLHPEGELVRYSDHQAEIAHLQEDARRQTHRAEYAEHEWGEAVERAEKAEAQLSRCREALEEIASRPTIERNPDGEDQAAHTMQLIARDALATGEER